MEEAQCSGCGLKFYEVFAVLHRQRQEFGDNLLCPGCRDEVSTGGRENSKEGASKMRKVTVTWRILGGPLPQFTTIEAPASPDDCTDTIETKLGTFLIQLASRGGYLIKISDVEFHE
jgi:hypothetical protein